MTKPVTPPKQYSEQHDLLHYMVPYRHFAYDPWEVLGELQTWLSRQPPTRATWTWDDADTDSPCGCKPRWETMSRLLGAWPLNQKNAGATVWVNPYYGQLDQLDWKPDEHKMTHVFRAGAMGTLPITTVAKRWNCNRKTIWDMCNTRGMPWGELREYGQQRLVNTIVVATQWTGRTVVSCARALGMPETTLRNWIDRYATVERGFSYPDEKWVGNIPVES